MQARPIDAQPKEAVCRQSATATYAADGFKAAAVTAIEWLAGSADVTSTRKVRRLRLTFDRPHAVVGIARGGLWDGVPLIHAWVDGRSDEALANRFGDFSP